MAISSHRTPRIIAAQALILQPVDPMWPLAPSAMALSAPQVMKNHGRNPEWLSNRMNLNAEASMADGHIRSQIPREVMASTIIHSNRRENRCMASKNPRPVAGGASLDVVVNESNSSA